jgi:hypothetical protein
MQVPENRRASVKTFVPAGCQARTAPWREPGCARQDGKFLLKREMADQYSRQFSGTIFQLPFSRSTARPAPIGAGRKWVRMKKELVRTNAIGRRRPIDDAL